MSNEEPTLEEYQRAVDIFARRRDEAYQSFKEWDSLYEQAQNALWDAEEAALNE